MCAVDAGATCFRADSRQLPLRAPWESGCHGLVLGTESFLEKVRQRLALAEADPEIPGSRQVLQRPPVGKAIETLADGAGGWSIVVGVGTTDRQGDIERLRRTRRDDSWATGGVRSPKPSALTAQAAAPTRSDAWMPAGICGAWHARPRLRWHRPD